MNIVACFLATAVSHLLYEVGTHRLIGYWAVERSAGLAAAVDRLEWGNEPLVGPQLDALNSDLARVGEFTLASPNPFDLVAAGCATEDAFSTWSTSSYRFLNHFLDGVNFQGLNVALGTVIGEPSDVWATMHPNNHFNWEMARAHYVAALVEVEPTDRVAHRIDMLRSLGQVLHLIQDAHQPSHTRNDSHSNHAVFPDGFSALELWARDAVSLRAVGLDPTVATAVQNHPVAPYRVRIGDYVRESARHTNREFFSDGTIWHNQVFPDYGFPNGSQTYTGVEGTWPFSQTYIYAQPSLHNTIPPTRMARERSGLLNLVPGVGLILSGKELDYGPYTLSSPGDVVVRNHATTLIPRAVAESAQALNHFFRLALQLDIDMISAPGEGRLKITNVSAVLGATPANLTVASGATARVYYESVSGKVLPLPGAPTHVLQGSLAPATATVVPFNALGAILTLADPIQYPNPDVRARPDRKMLVILQGQVGVEAAVCGAILKLPNGFPTPPGMVLIPAGTFMMGSNAPFAPPYWNDTEQQPVHQVTISNHFWMGRYEVTQAEFQALMVVNPSLWVGASNPVDTVSWNGARAYCAALTAQQAATLPVGYHYRLPTEAEWEYACRAGTTTEFHYGPDLFCYQARIGFSNHTDPPATCGNPNGTVPVGSYAPNAFGLYDMHGNLNEWCLDSYAPYSSAAVTDPFVTSTATPFRVMRSASWAANSFYCRSAARYDMASYWEHEQFGFRVVLAPVLVP
jgi:formylglycine-generating enzyme required for sulfatase activity